MGIASIYRALDLLARLGLVRRLDVGSASGYEPALPGGHHHHHVVCDRCGKVSSFEDPALEEAIDRLSTAIGAHGRRARRRAARRVPGLPTLIELPE